MNSEHLRQKLIAAARALPASEAVPYRFEKRIMAGLGASPRPDFTAWLIRALVKPTLFFLGIMALTSVWTFVQPLPPTTDNDAPEIENAIWAPLDSLGDPV